MRAEFISTTNPQFQHMVGRKDDLEIHKVAWFGNFHTSTLVGYHHNTDGSTTYKTLNSEYTFKELLKEEV